LAQLGASPPSLPTHARPCTEGNVIGCGVEMSLDPPGDGVNVSPCNDRVDEPVASSWGEVGLVETEPTEAVGVSNWLHP
jgi:hypothetical protein